MIFLSRPLSLAAAVFIIKASINPTMADGDFVEAKDHVMTGGDGDVVGDSSIVQGTSLEGNGQGSSTHYLRRGDVDGTALQGGSSSEGKWGKSFLSDKNVHDLLTSEENSNFLTQLKVGVTSEVVDENIISIDMNNKKTGSAVSTRGTVNDVMDDPDELGDDKKNNSSTQLNIIGSAKGRTHSHPRELQTVSLQKWQDIYNNIVFVRKHPVLLNPLFDPCSTQYVEQTMDYTDSDPIYVKYDESTRICYIYAEESKNDIRDIDWLNNISIQKWRIEGTARVGLEVYNRWHWKKIGWFSYYGWTRDTREFEYYEHGPKGFVEPANRALESVIDVLKCRCEWAHTYQYAGYSRGGGVVQILARQHYYAGLHNFVDVKIVTFNSPNTLDLEDGYMEFINLVEAVNIRRYREAYDKNGALFYFPDRVSSFPKKYGKNGKTLLVECGSPGYFGGDLPPFNLILDAHLCGGEKMVDMNAQWVD